MEKEFRKLPKEILEKMFYNLFLEKLSKNIKMYMKVNNIRKIGLYEGIKKDLAYKNICFDYKVFCALLDNDEKRSVGTRAALFCYLNEKLDVSSWYINFMKEMSDIDNKMSSILSFIENDKIPEKRRFTTEDAIFHEMMDYK
jgi:hypothetical protein